MATNARFLLVDDDVGCRHVLARTMRRHGETVEAGCLDEAIRYVTKTATWRAAIIDRRLPDGSGLELLQHLRSAGATAPAAMLSADIDGDALNTATRLGAFWIVKPVRLAVLEAFITATATDGCLATAVAAWTNSYGLTSAEVDVLTHCALGDSRETIADARGCSVTTIQKHISNLLRRTQDDSMQAAAARLLRDAYKPTAILPRE